MSSSDNVFNAFKEILGFARRQLNAPIQVPEIVFIGPQGHGKSSLIEALLGHPFTVVAEKEGGVTKRAVHVNLVNNADCPTPRVTIRRDASGKGRLDRVVDVEEVEDELQARNVISSTPIHVQYEVRNCWNVTYIDTPGLIAHSSSSQGDVGADEIEEMVLELIRPSHRLIVAVEDIKDGATSTCLSLVKRIDPRLDRTVFVYNKFRDSLKHFATSRDLNRYLSNLASVNAPAYFTTLLSSEERTSNQNKSSYQKKLEESVEQDLKLLESLQYDRKYVTHIGFSKLKRHIIQYIWKRYQDVIPELLKRLRSQKRQSEQKLSELRTKMDQLKDPRLRAFASAYLMQFLQNVENLLSGTLDGNPAVHGQTLEEEKNVDQTGEWRDSDFREIVFDPIEWKISHAKSKLYGAQQFERLLAEFKTVVDHQTFPELSTDEIATAGGPLKVGHVSNYTWATSDIVQRLLQKKLRPLVDQLVGRGKYIFQRLVDIESEMFEATVKHTRPDMPASADDLGRFPDFRERIKNLYLQYVDEVAEKCKNKCLDEFMTTRLIYWEVNNFDSKLLPAKLESAQEARVAVTKLANELFTKIKQRTAQNIVLKTYNFFLVPMQTELWSRIQGELTSLSNDELHADFKTSRLESLFKDREQDLQAELKRLEQDEVGFTGYANTFSKASLKDISF